MLELWDYFNIGGILLEIFGFALLLEKIKNWFQTKLDIRYSSLSQDYMDASNADKFYAKDMHERLTKFNSTYEQKKRENIGIILVIVGLIGQLLALIIEKIL